MAVSFDAKGTLLQWPTPANPINLTSLTVGVGEKRALLVFVNYYNPGGSVSGGMTVTWDEGSGRTNQACTLLGEFKTPTYDRFIQFWACIAPTSGNRTLSINGLGGVTGAIEIDAMSVAGVLQTNLAAAFLNYVTNNGTSAAPSVTVSSAAGDMVSAMLLADLNNDVLSATNGTNIYVGRETGANYLLGAASVQATATLSGSQAWSAHGISIKAAYSFGALKGSLSGGSNNIAASNDATGSVSVAVGDLVWGAISEQTALTAGVGSTNPSDNLGNTYAWVNAGSGTTSSLRAFYSRVTAAGTLTTVSIPATSSTHDTAFVADVYAGPFIVSPLDANPGNGTTDNSSPFTCPATGTLAQADELVVCAVGRSGSSAFAAVAPNLKGGEKLQSANAGLTLGYQAANDASTRSPAFTGTNPSAITLITASFKQDITITLVPAHVDLQVSPTAPSAVTKFNLSPPRADAQLTVEAPGRIIGAVRVPAQADVSLSTAAPTLEIIAPTDLVQFALPGVSRFAIQRWRNKARSPVVPVVTAESVALSPDCANLTCSTVEPIVSSISNLVPAAADLSVSSSEPVLSSISNLVPAAADLSVSSSEPVLSSISNLVPAAADLSVSSSEPVLSSISNLVPAAADLSVSSSEPVLSSISNLVPAAADLSVSSSEPVLSSISNLVPAAADLSVSSSEPVLSSTESFVPASTELAISSAEPLISEQFVLAPAAANLALSLLAPSIGPQPTSFVMPRAGRFLKPCRSIRGQASVLVPLPVEISTVEISAYPTSAQLALTVAASSLSFQYRIQPIFADLTLSSTAPVLVGKVGLSPSSTDLVLSATAPAARVRYLAQPESADLSLTASAPSLLATLSPTAANLALSVESPLIVFRCLAQPTFADLTLSSTAPSLGGNVGLLPDAANLSLSSIAPALLTDALVPQGNVALSVAAPSVNFGMRPISSDLVISTTITAIKYWATRYPASADLAFTSSVGVLRLGLTPSQVNVTLSTAAPFLATLFALVPASENLAFASVAPDIGGNLTKIPDFANLSLSFTAPAIQSILRSTRVDLVLSVVAPERLIGPVVLPAEANLALTAAAPTLKITEGRIPAASDLAISTAVPSAHTRFLATVPQTNIAISATPPILIRGLSPGSAQVDVSTTASALKYGATLYPTGAGLSLGGGPPIRSLSGDAYLTVPTDGIFIEGFAPILSGHPPRSSTKARVRGKQLSFVRKNASAGRRPAHNG